MERDPSNQVNIPKCLHKPTFRFIKVAQKEKYAIEKGWNKTANYTYNDPELLAHIANGGNYGFLTGLDNVVVIDADNKELYDWCEKNLPNTFKVKTRNGCHYFFRAPDLPKKVVLQKGEEHYGEIQHIGQYVVGPNSIHPSGATYQPLNEDEITTLTKEQVERIVSRWTENKEQALAPPKDNITLLPRPEFDPVEKIKRAVSVPALLGRYGITTSKNPTDCPMHNSKGGKCLSYKYDVWNCFHCKKAGDIFSLVMETEGIEFREAMEKIAKDFGIDINPRDPETIPPVEKKAEEKKTTEKTITPPPHHTINVQDQTKQQQIERLQWEALQWLGDKNRLASTECVVRAINIKYNLWVIEDPRIPRKEIYVYHEGIYLPNGRNKIEQFTRATYGKAHTSSLKHEILTKIEDTAELNIKPEDFFESAPVHLLPLANGIYNLKTRTMQEYTPEIIFLSKIPVEHEAEADCPLFKKFLSEVLKDEKDVKTMQQFFGFLLLRDYRYQKSVMMLGDGSNGKTVLIEIMRHFLGEDNVTSVSLQALQEDQYAVGNLLSKYANIAGDIGNEPIEKSNIIKQLTGREKVSANRKHMTHLEFLNYAKLVFACNNLPDSYDDSEGFWRRWLYFTFPNKFWRQERIDRAHKSELVNVYPRDPELTDKICVPKEMSGILNFALEGLDILDEERGFDDKHSISGLRSVWKRKSNSFFAFLEDEVSLEFGKMILEEDLYNVYSAYCAHFRLTLVSKKSMDFQLRQMGANRVRKAVNGERDYYLVNITFRHGIVDLNDRSKVVDLSRFNDKPLKREEQKTNSKPQMPRKPNIPENTASILPRDDNSQNVGNRGLSGQNEGEAVKPQNSQESAETSNFFVREAFFIKALEELHEKGHAEVDHDYWVEKVAEYHKKMIPDWTPDHTLEERFDKVIKQLQNHGEIFEPRPGKWKRL